MKRLIAALVALVAAWLGCAPTAAAAVTSATAAVCAYDGHHHVGVWTSTTTERGPPSLPYGYTTYDVVDHWSHGAFAGPELSTTPTIYTYDDLVPRVQVAGAAPTTVEPVEVSQAALASPRASGVAANSVRAAAPSSFVRTEALSGRASSRTVREIAESMRANGWQGPPVNVVELQGQRIVVDGHHRLAAARRAGIDVQYQVVDPKSVIGRGQWSSVDDILQDTYSVGRDRLR